MKMENDNKYCDHCKSPRHFKPGCFKLIGYPDWWKDPSKRGTTVNSNSHNTNNASTNFSSSSKHKQDTISDTYEKEDHREMAHMLREVYQMMKGKGKQTEFFDSLGSNR
ncbi:hypothetical protein M5689_024789 [Euphorbia peplus]|nr:hypothetical protein M5689_024789 [Euphorbia peplus]